MIHNENKWPLEHWLIELCTKCSLKCPRCLRQEQGFVTPNRDLSLQWFKENFTGKLLTDVRKITWSGVRGDPIYAKDFLSILDYIKSNNDRVQNVIITNGSYKTKDWWKSLDSILTDTDNIHFSIDGWDQKSNNLYRVNCDWDSILQGIDQLKNSDAYKTWAFIVFKFNQYKIDDIQHLAQTLKFDEFQITYSAKFNKVMKGYPDDDPLQPNDEFISSRWRHDRKYIKLSNKVRYEPVNDVFLDRFLNTDSDKQLLPLCKVGNKGLYINATGAFHPCCWVEPTYENLPGGKSVFNLLADSRKSLTEQMNDERWKKVFSAWDKGSTNKNFTMCWDKCSKKTWNQNQATMF
jgi:MoaA/NifB/PqqE/SkfB family radical SAM enzyme